MTAERALYAFECSGTVADETAALLGADVGKVELHRFPDGESIVRIVAPDTRPAFVFCSLDQPNERLVEVLLAADALRRQGVEEVVLVAPYLGYMRQDRVFRPGEPVSQRVVAGLLDAAFDGILTIEPHLHRIARLSEIYTRARARSASAAPAIADWLRDADPHTLVVGPDAESAPWIRSIADRCGLPMVVASKTRHGDRSVHIELPELPPESRAAWIVDDIASSGTTLLAATEALRAQGVERVGAIVAHALFDEGTLARLQEAKLEEIVSTNSLPHPTNRISIAPVLAEMIRAHESERETT